MPFCLALELGPSRQGQRVAPDKSNKSRHGALILIRPPLSPILNASVRQGSRL